MNNPEKEANTFNPTTASETTLQDRVSKAIQTVGTAFLGITAAGFSILPALLR